jgi:predicted ATP-grasp superfamily ATP-dependent carboligase
MEFFSAGGRLPGATDAPGRGGAAGDGAGRRAADDRDVPADLRAEGRALLAALLADLAGLPGVEPLAVADRAATTHLEGRTGAALERVPAGAEPAEAAVRAAEERPGAALWPVAPETRGRLERACRAAEEAGVRLVAPAACSVRRAAGRRALLRRLGRAGLPVPPTAEAASPEAARRHARRAGGAAVVKPGRGAGGAGTTRVEDDAAAEAAWSRAASVEPGLPPLVQPFVEGPPASALLLADADGDVRPLAFSRQRVRFTPGARYQGGRTPFRHPDARRALDVAADTARAAGGLRGLVGVDLVMAPDGPVVVEINPRLTTSYLGLRRHVGAAAAAAALRVSGLRPGGAGPTGAELPLGVGADGPEPASFTAGAAG